MSREEKKIEKYSKYKNTISVVMIVTFIVYLISLFINYFLGADDFTNTKQQEEYKAALIAGAITGIPLAAFGLFVCKLLLCAVCDHIIELCYANMISRESGGYTYSYDEDEDQEDDE